MALYWSLLAVNAVVLAANLTIAVRNHRWTLEVRRAVDYHRWIERRLAEGYIPWLAYRPATGTMVEMARPDWELATRIDRVGLDRALAVADLWWRPFPARS